MNILFTLCGRAGSQGVKGKNVRDLLGIPLVWYSMAQIARYKERYDAGNRCDIVLNTDSEALVQLVGQVHELEIATLRREPQLGGGQVPKVAVILDCLTRAEALFGKHYDMVVDLDLTSPLRRVADIRNAIERKARRPETDAVFSVTPSRRNPCFNMVKEENGFFCKAIPSRFAARQQAPQFYDMNASIYAYDPGALRRKEPQTFFNSGCDAVVMADTGILDIDSEEDFELMQVIARHLFDKDEALRAAYVRASSWKQTPR